MGDYAEEGTFKKKRKALFIQKRGILLQLKEPTTFAEQLALIREKGFIISEKQERGCIEFLQKTNYYRFSAYFLPFRKKDGMFFPNIAFTRVQRIYEFDSLLRGLVFLIIEDIEINLRTQLAYYVAHKYGALGYLSEEMFSKKHDMEKFAGKVEACIEENAFTLVVKHHKDIYDRQFPIWVIIEFFSIGMLSYFYKDMITEDKKAIAAKFNTISKSLESWLRCLTDLRNKCAHYSRLYYWTFTAMPAMPKNSTVIADRKLFTQLMVLKYLYPLPGKWNSKFIISLKAMIEEYSKEISLKHIGFPNNWEEVLSNK